MQFQVSNDWKREDSEDDNDINDEKALFANIGRESGGQQRLPRAPFLYDSVEEIIPYIFHMADGNVNYLLSPQDTIIVSPQLSIMRLPKAGCD